MGGDDQLMDGSTIVTHRSSHLCFPGIAFDLPTPGTFFEYTGIDPNSYYAEDTDFFEDWCADAALIRQAAHAGTMVARAVGLDPMQAYGLTLRRMFEYPVVAFASLDDLVHAFGMDPGLDKLKKVACSVSRLNAILFVAAALIIFGGLFFACCWPCFQCAAAVTWFFCCCGMCRRSDPPTSRLRLRRARRRSAKIDSEGGQ